MTSSFFITRGKDDEVEHLKKWLSTLVLPLKITRGDGTIFENPIECQIRPIQLWEFVYPKESHELVVNSLGLHQEGNMFISGYNINPKLWALRKLLGCEEFKKPTVNLKLAFPYERFKNVNIIGIGHRADGEMCDFKHEAI